MLGRQREPCGDVREPCIDEVKPCGDGEEPCTDEIKHCGDEHKPCRKHEIRLNFTPLPQKNEKRAGSHSCSLSYLKYIWTDQEKQDGKIHKGRV